MGTSTSRSLFFSPSFPPFFSPLLFPPFFFSFFPLSLFSFPFFSFYRSFPFSHPFFLVPFLSLFSIHPFYSFLFIFPSYYSCFPNFFSPIFLFLFFLYMQILFNSTELCHTHVGVANIATLQFFWRGHCSVQYPQNYSRVWMD